MLTSLGPRVLRFVPLQHPVTLLIHMQATTHEMCDATHSHRYYDSFSCAAPTPCDMTRSYVCNDCFTCVT